MSDLVRFPNCWISYAKAHFVCQSLAIVCLSFSDSTEAVKLTHEQMRIVKYKPKDDEVIKIVAFAGIETFLLPYCEHILT